MENMFLSFVFVLSYQIYSKLVLKMVYSPSISYSFGAYFIGAFPPPVVRHSNYIIGTKVQERGNKEIPTCMEERNQGDHKKSL